MQPLSPPSYHPALSLSHVALNHNAPHPRCQIPKLQATLFPLFSCTSDAATSNCYCAARQLHGTALHCARLPAASPSPFVDPSPPLLTPPSTTATSYPSITSSFAPPPPAKQQSSKARPSNTARARPLRGSTSPLHPSKLNPPPFQPRPLTQPCTQQQPVPPSPSSTMPRPSNAPVPIRRRKRARIRAVG